MGDKEREGSEGGDDQVGESLLASPIQGTRPAGLHEPLAQALRGVP